jgi:murein L,D-transpeptidase YcbB/YkuD
LPELPPTIDRELLDDSAIARFYDALDDHPAWSRDSVALLTVLGRAGEDCLDPADYRARPSADPTARDVALTRAALRYARDLSLGRVEPSAVDSLWRQANRFDPTAAVLAALRGERVGDLAALLRPPQAGYDALRRHAGGSDSSLVALNLERWRWLPRPLGSRYVMVNVPAAEAVAVDGGTVALTSRVVVGRPDWPTPTVTGAAEQLVFSPTWTVPPGIVRAELLAAARRDSLWVSAHGYRVFAGSRAVAPDTVPWATLPDSVALRWRYVMAPGPANPLGAVKLPFPNPFSVALHDTPERDLFAGVSRTASHGCVRVERMADLAAWLLAPAGWPADSVAALVAAEDDRERAIPLATPIPVYLTYFTASVDSTGALVRYADPYGWDALLAGAVAARHGTMPARPVRGPQHDTCKEEP